MKSQGLRYLASMILLTQLLVCCLPATASRSSSLLERDYLNMTNTELVAYEQQLSDELVMASRPANSDVSIGVGFGSWSGNSGYGVRADRWLGGVNDDKILATKIRREEVRAEMKRRHLLPP